jgi:putative colanic acid biosynthesis UDP-glucose lipid carrier transferase
MHALSRITTERHWWDFLSPSLDAASIMASLALLRWIDGHPMDDLAAVVGLCAIVLFLLISQLTGLHRRSDVSTADQELTSVAATWLLTVLGMMLLESASDFRANMTTPTLLGWLVLAPALIGLGRMCLRILQKGLTRCRIGTRRVAIAGFNELGYQIWRNIQEQPELGLQFVRFYDDRSELRNVDAAGPTDAVDRQPSLQQGLDQLVAAARRGDVDTVLITLPMRAENRIRKLLEQLSDTTVSVYIVPDFFVFELLHSRWTSLGGLPAVSVFENPLFGVDGMAKRAIDLVLASMAVVIGAVPMILVATAVKLTSPGPVLFRQKRYGLDGREILVWKFRTMRTCENGDSVKQATRNDPRVTWVGGILRRTSLDELPQLFNVITGSMSLVGPRPHASAHNEQYRMLIRGYMLRHKVKPGITGLAQVSGCRGETETIEKMQQRVAWDHRYIRDWSIWLDFKILLKTVLVVLKREQAY